MSNEHIDTVLRTMDEISISINGVIAKSEKQRTEIKERFEALRSQDTELADTIALARKQLERLQKAAEVLAGGSPLEPTKATETGLSRGLIEAERRSMEFGRR
jgi:hypothetical protein